MHQIKPGLRHQDLEGIHLPSFKFSLILESWQTAEDVMVYLAISPRSATIQKQKNRIDKVSLISKKI
jgi:hypothetical protein